MGIKRLKDSGQLAHAVKGLDATALLSTNRIVTPVRTKEDRLKLIAWSYANDGALTRLSDSGSFGPFISNVACPPVSNSGRIITALRQGGSLALMEWMCSGSAAALSVVTSGVVDSAATAVGASLGLGKTYVTAVRGTHGGAAANRRQGTPDPPGPTAGV
jgi:hypothetical protein